MDSTSADSHAQSGVESGGAAATANKATITARRPDISMPSRTHGASRQASIEEFCATTASPRRPHATNEPGRHTDPPVQARRLTEVDEYRIIVGWLKGWKLEDIADGAGLDCATVEAAWPRLMKRIRGDRLVGKGRAEVEDEMKTFITLARVRRRDVSCADVAWMAEHTYKMPVTNAEVRRFNDPAHATLRDLWLREHPVNSTSAIEDRASYAAWWTEAVMRHNLVYVGEVALCAQDSIWPAEPGPCQVSGEPDTQTPKRHNVTIVCMAVSPTLGVVHTALMHSDLSDEATCDFLEDLMRKLRAHDEQHNATAERTPWMLVLGDFCLRHKAKVSELLQTCEWESRFLPERSPFLSPVEQCFARVVDGDGRHSIYNRGLVDGMLANNPTPEDWLCTQWLPKNTMTTLDKLQNLGWLLHQAVTTAVPPTLVYRFEQEVRLFAQACMERVPICDVSNPPSQADVSELKQRLSQVRDDAARTGTPVDDMLPRAFPPLTPTRSSVMAKVDAALDALAKRKIKVARQGWRLGPLDVEGSLNWCTRIPLEELQKYRDRTQSQRALVMLLWRRGGAKIVPWKVKAVALAAWDPNDEAESTHADATTAAASPTRRAPQVPVDLDTVESSSAVAASPAPRAGQCTGRKRRRDEVDVVDLVDTPGGESDGE